MAQTENFEWGSDGDALSDSGGDLTWAINIENSSVIEIDTAQKFNGTRSALFLKDAWGDDCEGHFSLTAGNKEISFWIRKEDAVVISIKHGNGSKLIYIYIEVDEEIKYNDGYYHDTHEVIDVDTWTQFTIKHIDWDSGTYDLYKDGWEIDHCDMATSSDYENQFSFESYGTAGSFWVDNILVASIGVDACSMPPTSSVTPYVPIEGWLRKHGRASDTLADHLKDTNSGFANWCGYGSTVINRTTGEQTTSVGTPDGYELELTDDIFTAGDFYTIEDRFFDDGYLAYDLISVEVQEEIYGASAKVEVYYQEQLGG